MIRFKPTELLYPWTQWTLLVGPPGSEFRKSLDPDVAKWLAAWEFKNLAENNMFDEVRRFNRYGHYQGWFDCLKSQQEGMKHL